MPADQGVGESCPVISLSAMIGVVQPDEVCAAASSWAAAAGMLAAGAGAAGDPTIASRCMYQ